LGFAGGFILNSLLTQLYGIRTMLIVHAELSVFVALLFTIYFPSGPPTPPSASAEEDRTSFLTSLKKMITNYPFVLLVTSCGVIVGLNGGFQSVLSIILNPSLGFNDRVIVHSVDEFFYSTSWMGLVLYLVSTFTGQITGLFADRFQRNFKLILMILIGLATVFFIWFSLSIYGWGSSNPINLFFSFCMYSILIGTSMPIYYEAAVESTYPVTEGTSAGMLSLSINVGNLIFAIVGLAGVFSDQHPERAKIMSLIAAGSALITL
jgi:FLVCR family MFS transporter